MLTARRYRRPPQFRRLNPGRDGRVAVDDDVPDELQQLGCAVGALRELEQFRVVIDERRGALPCLEDGVTDHVLDERYVGLDTADTELAQCALQLVAGVCKGEALRR